jgi:hypothetical protein
MDYIQTFNRFDFLYMNDLQSEYAAFMKTNPSLESFELELKKYMVGSLPEHSSLLLSPLPSLQYPLSSLLSPLSSSPSAARIRRTD